MVISKSENFKDDTIQLKRKYELINREISGIREKHQVGKKGISISYMRVA